MRSLMFNLAFALPSLNVRQRQHWGELHRQQDQLSMEVMAAIGGPRYFPRPPFAAARVTVWRHSAGALDADNLAASCKNLLDVLCIKSGIHPQGLGIIIDDAPAYCELIVKQASAPRGQQKTVVLVEELPALEISAKPRRRARAAA